MTKITVTFNVSDEDYKAYNHAVDGILNDLYEVGASDLDITEDETSTENDYAHYIQNLKKDMRATIPNSDNMTEDEIEILVDELLYKEKRILKCPHCNKYMGDADCPDLFASEETLELCRQEELLREIQLKGFNIVVCDECGQVFIHRTYNET